MKLLSLLFICCACSFSLQGMQCEFKQLAARVESELHNAPLGAALLQVDAFLEENISAQELEASIKQAEETLQAARKAANCCEFLEAGCTPGACNKELLPLFARLKTEIAKASFELQKRKTKEKKTTLQDCPASVCNGVTTIAAAPFTISAPGHYCLTADVTGTITINSSNVELSLDKHTIFATGLTAIAIQINAVSNVKIGGCGTLAFSSGIIGIGISAGGPSDNITIEDLEILDFTAIGMSASNVTNITCKNISMRGNRIGMFLGNFKNATVSSCLFSGSSFAGFRAQQNVTTPEIQGLVVEDCFFDSNNMSIQIDEIEDIFINRNFITNSLDFGITTSNTGQPTVFLNNVYIKDSIIDTVSAGNGIQLDTISNLKIEGCQILDTSAEGILLTNAENVKIEGTQVLGSGASPISLSNLWNSSVSESIFATTVGVAPFAAMTVSQTQALQVKDCVFSAILQDPTSAGVNGIAIQSSTGFEIENSIIETNARSTDSLGGSGITISNGSRNGVIRGCLFPSIQPNIASMGILVTGESQSMRIEGCTIDGAFRTGLRLEGLQFGLVQNNRIKSVQSGSGITLKAANGVSILGNMIVGNGTHGIHLAKNTISCAIRDNTVAKNNKVGINNHSKNKSNKIYHNYAQANKERNYEHVGLVASPHEGLGFLENISS